MLNLSTNLNLKNNTRRLPQLNVLNLKVIFALAVNLLKTLLGRLSTVSNMTTMIISILGMILMVLVHMVYM